MEMLFPVTSLTILPLFVLVVGLSLAVSARRGATGIALGDGGDAVLRVRIRRHANFTEAVPIVLIVMMLAEGAGVARTVLLVAGTILVLARLVHPFGLRADNPAHPLRIAGGSGTSLAGMICLVALALRLLSPA